MEVKEDLALELSKKLLTLNKNQIKSLIEIASLLTNIKKSNLNLLKEELC